MSRTFPEAPTAPETDTSDEAVAERLRKLDELLALGARLTAGLPPLHPDAARFSYEDRDEDDDMV